MTTSVKTRRYESPHRQEQAATTRRKILDVARRRFLRHGYSGTTMAAVASDAGVVVETVYRAFGGKAALFAAVVEVALAGGARRAELPVEARPAIAAVIAEPDPRRKVAMYAATQPGIHRRSGPLLRAVRDAAAIDPEVARLWRELEDWRYAGQRRFIELLGSVGALRPDLEIDAAAAVLWTLCSLAVHDQFVQDRGWSPDQYERWLTDALSHQLLRGD